MSTGIFRERLFLLRKRYRSQMKVRNGRDVSQGTPPFGKERVELGFCAACFAPAKRTPHAGGQAGCKLGGIFGRN